MAELEGFINVHAQFPQNVVLDTEHDHDLNPANWEWEKCLIFPVSELNNLRFSLKPYKWIRFATGIVMGARGDLCTERDLPHPVPIDYDSDLSAVSMDLYYHTSDQEKRRMFPIDPKIADARTVTSSWTSVRRTDFREVVLARDGRCVVTGHRPKYCDAAHLLPHSKGDTYIERFSTHRRRDSSGSDVIVRDIDDVRNGLLLSATLHRALGTDLAFLKTPNFAMDTTDVDSSADRAQERLTSHLFTEPEELLPGLSNSAVRVPSDTSIWPPTVLFDAVYAGAVVEHFGVKVPDFLKKWGTVFYPGGPTKAAHADDKHRRDQADADKEKYNQLKEDRQRRREVRDGRGTHDAIDPLDVAMMYRFKAMEPEKVRAYLKGCEDVAAARERKGLEEKVNSWRDSLAPLT